MYMYMYVHIRVCTCVHVHVQLYLLLQRVWIGEFSNQLPVAQGSWMNKVDRLTYNIEIDDGNKTY